MDKKTLTSRYISPRAPKVRERRNPHIKRVSLVQTRHSDVSQILFNGQIVQQQDALPRAVLAVEEPEIIAISDILSLPVFPDNAAEENFESSADSSGPAQPQRAGEFLRVRREELGMSIADAAHAIHTAPCYIRAIEESYWRVFPARVYAEGFFKKLLAVLAVEKRDELLGVFADDWSHTHGASGSPFFEYSRRKKIIIITSRHIILAATSVLVAGIVGFLTLRLVRFTGAPGIVLRQPAEQAVLHEPIARIAGSVDGESQVTVNNREMKIDERGNFDEEIALRPGVNTFEFHIVNRLKKETIVTRHVIVE